MKDYLRYELLPACIAGSVFGVLIGPWKVALVCWTVAYLYGTYCRWDGERSVKRRMLPIVDEMRSTIRRHP